MKTTTYATLVALGANALILPPAHAAYQRHTGVYIEQYVTVTTTSCRSVKDIVRDIGILCEALLDKPNMYHPGHLLEILDQLIGEYMAAQHSHTQQQIAKFHQLRTKLTEIKQAIDARRANAIKILTDIRMMWPCIEGQSSNGKKEFTFLALPQSINTKLQTMTYSAQGLKICKDLQSALNQPCNAYQHKSAQEVCGALFKR